MTWDRSWIVFTLIFVSIVGWLLSLFAQVASSPQGPSGAAGLLFQSYPGLLVAMAAGSFGACFSMLLQSQKRASEGTLEDLMVAGSWHTLVVRVSVGLGAAAILYFFFRSGLLEGSLWPSLSGLRFEPLDVGQPGDVIPNQHWCLLVIWCFLAGFSETLVPNLLSRAESQAK